MRTKVSTGYHRLDEVLQGGFLSGSAVVLAAPASDEVPLMLRKFFYVQSAESLLITQSLSSAEVILGTDPQGLRCLVCSDKPVPPSKNTLPGKGIENLTELSLLISEIINSLQPKRVAIQILSDILLRHKALQTRKWFTDILTRLKNKGITTLAVINPNMHSKEEAEAVLDLFDGKLEIFEKDVDGMLRKFLRVTWMHGVEVAEKEFPLIDLPPEPQTPSQQATVTKAPLKEPRWLTPLVSRTEELSKLKAAFENALANRSSVVALQGEAGVGKTRLMQELAVNAQPQGAVVLTGSATQDGLPYGPWIEVARQYIAQAPGELLRRIIGVHVSEFAKLVPDIVAKLGTIPPSKPLGEQQDKIRLYEAVTQFFTSICREAPLLLLFDDMQYGDRATLDLLEYFVRGTSNLPVLTVCSYREEEVEANSPLYLTFMKLNRQRLLETIFVKNLNKEETMNLIKQIFGEQTLSSEFADLIFQRTGGNPFFVEEVLRSLVEDGTIFRTEKGWDRKPIQELTVPESVKVTLRSRLTKLQPEVLSVLQWAAVAGSEFDFVVLQEISQVDEDTLLQRIETALSSGTILESPLHRGNFKFADNRVRELLLDDLSRIRRGKYHLKIAEAMEKLYSKNLDKHAELIANHFSEGGDGERTIRYSIMAGDRNEGLYAHEQAINNYKRALDLIDIEGGDEQQKAAVLEKLADSYLYAGQLQNSTQCYQQALVISEKLHDNRACARACRGLADTIGRTKGTTGYREYAQVIKRGLKYLEAEPESFEAASMYSDLATGHGLIDEWNEANAWAERALEAGEKTKNYGAVAVALANKASFLTDTGRTDEGLPLWERAMNVALQHEQYEETLYAMHNLSIYTYPRNLAKAMEIALRRLDLARRLNLKMSEVGGLSWLSFLNWFRGDWVSAMADLEKAFEIQERLEIPPHTYQLTSRGRLFLSLGDLERSEADFQKDLGLLREEPKITRIVGCHLGLGLLRLEQDRTDEAKAHLQTCVNAFKEWEFTTMPLWHIETLLHLTSIYASDGETEKAQEASKWANRLASQLRSDAGMAMALQAQASVLLAAGDRAGAEEAYLECLSLWEKASWPYYQAKALVAYSQAIAEASPDESRRKLKQAAEIFKKLGAKRDLEKAQARLSA